MFADFQKKFKLICPLTLESKHKVVENAHSKAWDWLGVMAHACNPSILGGQGEQIT